MAALISSSANLSSMSISNHSDYQQLPCISLDLAKAGDISRAAKSLGLDRMTLQHEPDDYLTKRAWLMRNTDFRKELCSAMTCPNLPQRPFGIESQGYSPITACEA
jgi:hypothetical protein